MWDNVKKAVNILWTVGERLRVVYTSSDNEETRRRDRRRTAVCVGVFAVSCVALVVIDTYGDAFTAARSVTAKVRALGGGRVHPEAVTATSTVAPSGSASAPAAAAAA